MVKLNTVNFVLAVRGCNESVQRARIQAKLAKISDIVSHW